MAYAKADVDAALIAPTRKWRFRHEVIGNDGMVKDVPLDVSSAVVRNNDLATQVKRTASYIIGPDTGMDLFKDRIRSYAALRMPDNGYHEWATGTFRLSKNGSRFNNNQAGPYVMDGYDGLLDLMEDCILARLVINAGATYRTEIIAQLTAAGFGSAQISNNAEVLPGAKEWDPGTSRLTIINELLDAIGFNPIKMDPYGVPTSQPYQAPTEAPIDWTYRVDANSVVLPDVDAELDWFNVPNVWLATISEPDRPVLTSVLTNNDPLSRLSTVNRGRNVVQVLTNDSSDGNEDVEAATQALLDAKVARAMAEATQLYETAKFSTGLMPFHGSGDVAVLDYGAGPLRYREHEWEMALVAGGIMTHTYRRVVVL